jgi:Mrp family chromosome partitioning ATPase
LHPTGVEGLHLLTSGAHVPNPSELLASQTFRRLLELLMEHFDMIIIDSPPILAVTDAVVLAGQADGVAVVVNSGESRLPAVARALERLTSVDANILGVIVNRMTSGSGGYYYHYYYYQYDYQYGHDNGHGEPKKKRVERRRKERRKERVRKERGQEPAADGQVEPVREDAYA